MNINDMNLVWEDDFSAGSMPSEKNWKILEWPVSAVNGEVQCYTKNPENIYVSYGTLKLRAEKNSEGEWSSARITTHGRQSWKYGYVEARIKLPKGHGVMPAFWMMPEESVYGVWPKSGELDILQYSPCTFGDDVFSTIHYGTGTIDNESHFWKDLSRAQLKNVTDEFHTYGMLWTEDKIEFLYDGEKIGSAYERNDKDNVQWPYDQKYHIILNLAMGGHLGGEIDEQLKDATMEIEYVRVYQ